ncbi:glycerophosphodiester phosphodiesterase family protein [Pedobacter sp. UBA5917]|jgi:glycerophosphoryl diester phosphodiesterase|uniref:glycerophosphodiester phosphodiesterase family protein n=1 Tax=Pedobacter sp. UBA5917 TaxID=1947061 RepID=UPI0025D03B5B|nr:glycerophosphodiester phosphodiesterase family protein [Pedobacter sp. UBA5917]
MGIKLKPVLLGILFSSLCIPAFAQQVMRPLPKSKNAFIVIAHRGSHLIKPENTIASITEAIALGADYVELDLRTTKDGQLVLLHNDRVDGVSNGKGLIKDLDFETVKKLVLVGKDSSLHHIPSFEEALKACKGKINIYLDFKAADAEKAYQAIKKAGMEHQVLVYVGGNDYLSWRKTAPEMPLMSRLDKAITSKEGLMATMAKTPLKAIDNVPNEQLLPVLKSMGISIFMDVQKANETSDDWDKAIKHGVQGLQTDHPEALIKYLKGIGMR